MSMVWLGIAGIAAVVLLTMALTRRNIEHWRRVWWYTNRPRSKYSAPHRYRQRQRRNVLGQRGY